MFVQGAVEQNGFLREISALRDVSREVMIADAAVAETAWPRAAIALLQTVLAAEIVCVLRYTMISVSRDGLKNEWIGAEFQEQANDERRHMMMAAARIEALGGVPDFSPTMLAAGMDALGGAKDFAVRVRENLAAEQSVIEHYHELIGFFEPRDPQTARVLEEILRDEQDHTSDMEDFLVSYMN